VVSIALNLNNVNEEMDYSLYKGLIEYNFEDEEMSFCGECGSEIVGERCPNCNKQEISSAPPLVPVSVIKLPSINFKIIGAGLFLLLLVGLWYAFFSIEKPTVSISRCDLINSGTDISTSLEILVSNKNQANNITIMGIFQPKDAQGVYQKRTIQLDPNQQTTIQFSFPSSVSTSGACSAIAIVVLDDSDARKRIGLAYNVSTENPSGLTDKLSCPSSCDDGNPCTRDFCSRATEFACRHESLSGDQAGCSGSPAICRYNTCEVGVCVKKTSTMCCGNEVCENSEDLTSCPADCKPSVTFSCAVPAVINPAGSMSGSSTVSCLLTNTGTRTAVVTMTSSLPSWSDTNTQTVNLPAGEQQNIFFIYKFGSNFYSNGVTTSATISFTAQQEGRQIYSDTKSTQIGAKGDIDWSNQQVAYAVTPQDPCVEGVLSIAKEKMPGRSLSGYKGDVDSQVKAIYEAVQDLGVSYVNSILSFTPGTVQRVRLPYESINEKSGNCADGAILFASLFENLGMEPVIINIPGHSFVAVKSASDSNTWIFVETTMVGTSTYEQAKETAWQEYSNNKNVARLYDVKKLRNNKYLPRPQIDTVSCNLQLRKCADGTVSSTCSSTKPKYCFAGSLINKASVCGCPSGMTSSGESCIQSTCADGTLTNQCSSTKPKYCSTGTLINKASVCGCPSGQVKYGDTCIDEINYQNSVTLNPLASYDIISSGQKNIVISSSVPVDVTLQVNDGSGRYFPYCSSQGTTYFAKNCYMDGNKLIIKNGNLLSSADVQITVKNLPS